MADIKRLHYFDHQFLVEADFTDEQTYHLGMRRRHNKVLHTFGVAEGLQVEKTGDKEVTVGAGTTVDRDGRELVLDTDKIIDLSTFPGGDDIYVTIAYDEQETDPTTATGVTGNTRVTETPQVQAATTAPPGDGSVIRLANFTLTGGGNVPGNNGDTFDTGLRQFAGSSVAPNTIGTSELANGAVTGDKIANGTIGEKKLDSSTRDKLVTNGNAHNHSGGDGAQIGHSSLNRDDGTNPHGTTATNIDTQGGTNRIVARINAGTGIIQQARIDPAIARETRFHVSTGHDHDGANSRRIAPTNLNGVNNTVTAAALNTITGGAASNASNLHYHQNIPIQTRIYTASFPLLKYGNTQEFTSIHYNVRCPSGIICYGVAPVYLRPGIVIRKMGVHTDSSGNFDLTVWLVYSSVQNSSGVSVNRMVITSPGYSEVSFSHTIQASRNYTVWVYMNAAPASEVIITGIFLEYQFSTLF